MLASFNLFKCKTERILDTGLCLPAISCASQARTGPGQAGADRRGYWIELRKAFSLSTIQYQESSIQYRFEPTDATRASSNQRFLMQIVAIHLRF
jgi:hypothetical protein